MAFACRIPVVGLLFLFLAGSLQIQEAVAFSFSETAQGILNKAKHLLPCYDECYVPCEKRFPNQPEYYKFCRNYCLSRDCIPDRVGKVWRGALGGDVGGDEPSYSRAMYNGEHERVAEAPGAAPLNFNASLIEKAASGPALARNMSEQLRISLHDLRPLNN